MKYIKQIDEYLQQKGFVSPWIQCDVADWQPLLNKGVHEQIKKGGMLAHRSGISGYVYVVRSGRFRVYFEDWDGNESCIYIAETGSLLGEVPALDGTHSYSSVQAIVDSTVIKVTVIDFIRLCQNDPVLSRNVMKNLCRKIRLMSSEMEFFSKKAMSRVAIALLAICLQYGRETSKGVSISIRFTHEEVGNLTGLTRVTVSKLFTQFSKDGILLKHNGKLVVTDVDYLMNII